MLGHKTPSKSLPGAWWGIVNKYSEDPLQPAKFLLGFGVWTGLSMQCVYVCFLAKGHGISKKEQGGYDDINNGQHSFQINIGTWNCAHELWHHH
jgi:hypothetical protein